MDNLPINGLDLVVIIIVLISAVLALLRGFVKEVLGILAIVGAGFSTLWLFTPARTFARQYIEAALLADIVAGATLFIVTMIVFSLVSSAISHRVRESSLGPLDRTLGFLFGLVRGGAIVSLAWLAMNWVWETPAKQPDWMKDARTAPFLHKGGDVLRALVPASLLERGRGTAREAADTARTASDAAKILRPSQPDTTNKNTYNPGSGR
jgi:membrane protein required for colicin V production